MKLNPLSFRNPKSGRTQVVKRGGVLSFLLLAGIALRAIAEAPAPDPLSLTNMLVGGDPYRGATFVGAARPFPLVRLGPDMLHPSNSGYNSKEPIVGFSHTHTSGTGGIGYYGNIRFTPQSGTLDVVQMESLKQDEVSQPGLYRVRLKRDDIGVELTATDRVGVHRYTFTAGATPRVLVDISAVLNTRQPPAAPSSVCTGASARFVSDRRIEGQASFESDFGKFPHTVWFAAEFNQPVIEKAVWLNDEVRAKTDAVQSARGQRSGLVATFAPGAPVEARVGISFQSIDHARAELTPTLGRSFDEMVKESQSVWRNVLDKIEITGGTETQRRQFYTALVQTQLMPTNMTGDHGAWKTDEPHYDDLHAIWDVFRCTYALHTLIAPETMRGIIRCELDIYKHKGWLADYWRGRTYNVEQGGTNMDVVLADALVKRLGGFDAQLAYAAMKKDATIPTDRDGFWLLNGRHTKYFSLGYVPAVAGPKQTYVSPVSATLEYAYNDFCVAQGARALGHEQDAQKFLQQSDNVWKLFNPQTKFFWAKNEQGAWLDGFDADRYSPGTGVFGEGTPWIYRFYAPQDMAGLIERHGGAEAFVRVLDEYFDGHKHDPGNEPAFLTPWLYHYAGRPDKSADRVQTQLAKDYSFAPAAYRGDDDSGSMSAWYVFGAMGFYPVTGQDVYLIGSPVFTSSRIKLEHDRVFTVTAHNISAENRYVQSATFRGKPWEQAWLRHADLVAGGELVLEMGSHPSAWGTKKLPPSHELAKIPAEIGRP